MKRELTIVLMSVLLIVFLSGCTTESEQGSANLSSTTETVCAEGEEICSVGTPGLFNEESIYSGSDTFFSIVLRNNLEGQEANNIRVQLSNVGPFSIIEGYESELVCDDYENEVNCSCVTSEGVWRPHDNRTIFRSPNPQFVDDLDNVFAVHFLDTMYPNEEVEFLWRLRAPDYQEIANVGYEHGFDYDVSYDYKSSLLQTIYVLSEQEYQRILSQTGEEPTTTGTVTGTVGALNIQSNVEEPVRVQDNQSQFSLVYEVYNERDGIPEKPAMFLLQYPEGTEHVGGFVGPKSIEQYGYVDVNKAVEYYNQSGAGMEGGVCIPKEFDPYSSALENAAPGYNVYMETATCSANFKSITLSDLFAYVRETYPDLEFSEANPRFVIKFLYPVDLLDETNYLYYQMKSTESIDISKYYTFRLKTKYRYSFSGSDDILVVPNVGVESGGDEITTEALLWGNMAPHFDYVADSYSVSGETLTMTKDDLRIESTVRELNQDEYGILHLVKVEDTNSLTYASCTSDDDCGSSYTCDTGTNRCQYCNNGDCEYLYDTSLYSVRIGYPTMESHINEVLSTGEDYYAFRGGDVLYFFNEYTYLEDLNTARSVNDETSNHVFNYWDDEISVSEAAEEMNNFMKGKSFIEISNETGGYEFSDNDEIGYFIDFVDYETSTSGIDEGLKIINYYDNETLFTHEMGDTELISVYSSPIDGSVSDNLILYYFNDDNEVHYIQYNISVLDSTELATGDLEVDTNTLKSLKTTYTYSLNPDDTLNKHVSANDLKKYDWEFDSITNNAVHCYNNINDAKPILVIDYYDFSMQGSEMSGVNAEGSIIIGDYDSLDDLNSALKEFRTGDVKFVKGVVNICYES